MLSKISHFVKENQKELILLLGVIMISSLSYAFGYVVAKTESREYLEIEEPVMEQIDEITRTHRYNS
ncbi:MAG: hypothetical protein WBK67_01090 [Minisyncoccales bacterium]|jgi:hypothetical protein